MRDASGNVMSTYESFEEPEGEWSYMLTERHIYGSSRLGMDTEHIEMIEAYSDTLHRRLSLKQYELSNHLGNVLTVINDIKLPVTETTGEGENEITTIISYTAVVISATDYSPFGVALYGRTWSSESYRYGFNGKEKDNEGMGGGNQTYDYGFRIYNPGLGKFLSVDPLHSSYPWYTPYQFAGNTPIVAIDIDGLELGVATSYSSTTTLARSNIGLGRYGGHQLIGPKLWQPISSPINTPGYRPVHFGFGLDCNKDGQPDLIYLNAEYQYLLQKSQLHKIAKNHKISLKDDFYAEAAFSWEVILNGWHESPFPPPPSNDPRTATDGELEAALDRIQSGDAETFDYELEKEYYLRKFEMWQSNAPFDAAEIAKGGCEELAKALQQEMGGEIMTITAKTDNHYIGEITTPSGEKIGRFYSHVALVRDGMVYDAITGHAGMKLEDYKNMFTDKDCLDFCWDEN